jgi:hypothetical protein
MAKVLVNRVTVKANGTEVKRFYETRRDTAVAELSNWLLSPEALGFLRVDIRFEVVNLEDSSA